MGKCFETCLPDVTTHNCKDKELCDLDVLIECVRNNNIVFPGIDPAKQMELKDILLNVTDRLFKLEVLLNTIVANNNLK